ncbi:Predicted acetyltransferase, GNAT superfamily [Chryseobacterium arachidis]|uniref:Predicted acetyltransferase, GNAT superfamily n=1 Tax=Chryseobacterium arachidis TaxID=1416778 RepID=A0A1M5G7I6_9FLAO|nr:GNAT family N-acetyltransferase [Chryseobacterium arachidis]SHF99421.1 Predicted acetyltransferase, GNAT superfamily [Chryseobacterium arachidis]
MTPKIVKSKADIELCKEVILAFRPNVKEENYVELVMEMMEKDGFKIAYIPNEDHTKAVAFTGYRPQLRLLTGKMIYIDDLFTSPECRGKGYAAILLNHVAEEARKNGFQSIHLDSGYMLHDAHRLYLNQGYILGCNHFIKVLS